MKIRRLPETDLARIAPLPADEQRRQLEQYKAGWPPFSYRPLRHHIRDIINVTAGPLFGPAADPTRWDTVEQLIRRLATPGEEYASNIGVAQALHAYCIDKGVRARAQDIRPLRLSLDLKVEYGSPFLMLIGAVPLIPFFDPRRWRRLTETGRRFALSMMHEATRAADPDLAEVRLGVFQFDSVDDGSRLLKLYTDEGVPLYAFDELDEMIRQTYAVWGEVLAEREAEARREAVTRSGPWFGRK